MNLIGKKIVVKNILYDIVPANSKDQSCVSLHNPQTNAFLRHREGRIIESENDGSEFFLFDSSFVPHEIEDGFSLSCSNKGLERHRICTVNGDTFVVNPDIAEYVFTVADDNVVLDQGLLFWGKDLIGQRVTLLGTDYTIVPANNGRKDCLSLKNAATDRFLRHKGGKLQETSSDDGPKFFPADSSFVPVTCGQAFALFCSNKGMEKVGICKIGGTFIVDPKAPLYYFLPVSDQAAESKGTEDSSFLGKYVEFIGNLYSILPGNNGDKSCVSLQNTENFLFLRHREGSLQESPALSDFTYFPLDSSFQTEEQGNGFILHCSNPKLTNHSICVVDDDNGIVSPDMDPYCFQPFSLDHAELSTLLNESLSSETEYAGGLVNPAFFAARALAKSSLFDCEAYYQSVPDIARSVVDPILHFVREGYCQGIPASPRLDHALYAEALLLLHMLSHADGDSAALYASLAKAGYFARGIGKGLGSLLSSARIVLDGEGKREKPLTLSEDQENQQFSFVLTENGIRSVGTFAMSPLEVSLHCASTGKVSISFGPAAGAGAQIKYTRIAVYKNSSLMNGLKQPVLTTSEKPYTLHFPCSDANTIKIQAEWTPCVQSPETLISLLQSLVAERYPRNTTPYALQ